MKPILLKIQGLNSFVEEQTIDFADLTSAGLFGIFGPTGSGKSSIVDAITMAIYGQISRFDEKKPKQAMNTNSDVLAVTFRFGIGENTYEIVRAYKRSKDGITPYIVKLLQIKGGEILVIADTLKETEKEVVRIIGLNYQDFSRSVVLPQGKFSDFLLLEGVNRGDMLERIFDLSKYGDVMFRTAKDALNTAKTELQGVQLMLEEIGEISKEVVEEKKENFNVVNEQRVHIQTQLNEANKKLTENRANLDIYKEFEQTIQRLLAEFEATKQQLADNEKLITKAKIGLETAENNYVNAQKVKDERYVQLLAKQQRAFQALEILKDVQELEIERDRLRVKHSKLSNELKVLLEKKASLSSKKVELDGLLSDCEKRKILITVSSQKREWAKNASQIFEKQEQLLIKSNFLEIKHKDTMGKLANDTEMIVKFEQQVQKLKAEIEAMDGGKPCPTCGMISNQNAVAKLEEIAVITTNIAVLNEKVITTLQTIETVKSETNENFKLTKSYAESLELLENQLGTNQFSKLADDIKSYDLELENIEQRVQTYRLELVRIDKDGEPDAVKITELTAQIESVLAVGKEKKATIDKQTLNVLKFTENQPPQKYYDETTAEIERIVQNESQTKLQFQEISESFRKLNEINFQVKTIIATNEQRQIEEKFNVEKRLKSVDIEHMVQNEMLYSDKVSSLNDALEQKSNECIIMKADVDLSINNLKKAKLAVEKSKELSLKCGYLTDLASLFSGKQFVRFMAKRQLHYITTEASKRLKIMTNGRFAISLLEGNFAIIDNHNGGISRSPRSLSGGETFLASLALALALSSKIQLKSNAPLEFFFLDEGFGTLDPSLLDATMDSLSQLQNEKMSVGIITHVDEIKNRIMKKLIVTPSVPGVRGTCVEIQL